MKYDFNEYDEMNEDVKCKYCGHTVKFGDMIWLNGKCMCPDCYQEEKRGDLT